MFHATRAGSLTTAGLFTPVELAYLRGREPAGSTAFLLQVIRRTTTSTAQRVRLAIAFTE